MFLKLFNQCKHKLDTSRYLLISSNILYAQTACLMFVPINFRQTLANSFWMRSKLGLQHFLSGLASCCTSQFPIAAVFCVYIRELRGYTPAATCYPSLLVQSQSEYVSVEGGVFGSTDGFIGLTWAPHFSHEEFKMITSDMKSSKKH